MALSLVANRLYSDRQARENLILRIGLSAICLVLALKKYTVGIDIVGYKEQYIISKAMPWLENDYVYFEPGYIVFMKIFSKSGFDFQFFMIITYIFVCLALYFFIKKYSPNVTMSLIIFICYQFMVFYISGVRQMIAMSICLFAFMVLDREKGKKVVNVLLAVGLILLAYTFHRSALIFFLVIPFALIEFKKIYFLIYIPIFLGSVFLRKYVLLIVDIFIGEVKGSGEITLNGNFLFLALLTVFSLIGVLQYKTDSTKLPTVNEAVINKRFLYFVLNMTLLVVVLQVSLSGSTILRGLTYLTLFLIPGIPVVLKSFERKIEILTTWVLLLLFLYLFFTETLLPNQFNMCPYLFFWQ